MIQPDIMSNYKSSISYNLPRYIGQFINDISGVTQQQEYNSAEAQKERDFNLDLAKNMYKYTMQDMLDSGINAAAALTHGASLNPGLGGSSASSNINNSNFLPNLVFSASSLMNSVNNSHELKNRDAVRNVNNILHVISTAAKLATMF